MAEMDLGLDCCVVLSLFLFLFLFLLIVVHLIRRT